MEPPDWVQPSRLYLGQAYLQARRYPEAEATFREELRNIYRNGWALRGLADSLKAQGKLAQAGAVEKEFTEAWRHADVTLPAAHF